jgi:hypothetical protein
LKALHRRAVDLLGSHPVEQVAQTLGMRPKTVRGWMQRPEFAAELRARDKETAESLTRIAHHAALLVAINLEEAAASGKLDYKALLEVLKLCSAYDPPAQDTDILGEVIGRICADGTEN